MHAIGHKGCLFDISQADRALGVYCCLCWPYLRWLAQAVILCSSTTLSHDTQCFALTRETCELLELVWQKGHMDLFSTQAGCMGGRTGGVNPSRHTAGLLPAVQDSSCPAAWPCSPLAAVACGQLVIVTPSHCHCSSRCHTSKGRGTVVTS